MYAKIFSQIFDSSISEDYLTRHVFMDLLVLADADGIVDMTIAAISRRTCVPVEVVSHAIEKLMQPDIQSRSSEHEGRRLVPLDSRGWGWAIVNYCSYRGLKDEGSRREYFREYRRRTRDEHKQVVHKKFEQKVNNVNNVNSSPPPPPPSPTSVTLLRNCNLETIGLGDNNTTIRGVSRLESTECSHVHSEHCCCSQMFNAVQPETDPESEREVLSTLEGVERTERVGDSDSAPQNGAAAVQKSPGNTVPSKAERERWFDEEFWVAGVVWQKVGTGASRKAWLAKVQTRERACELISAARLQGPAIMQHATTNGHSVLHPATWINQERWRDDVEAALPLATARTQNTKAGSAAESAVQRRDREAVEGFLQIQQQKARSGGR